MGRFCGIDPSLIDEVLSKDDKKDSRDVVEGTVDKEEADDKNEQELLKKNNSISDSNN